MKNKKKESFLRTDIYEINLFLCVALVFMLGFMIGSQKSMMKMNKAMMYKQMSNASMQLHRVQKGCPCMTPKRNMLKSGCQGMRKLPPEASSMIQVKELSEEEAKAEFARVQKKINAIHNDIMEQQNRMFNW